MLKWVKRAGFEGTLMVVLLLLATTGAYAASFDLGNGATLDWDTTLRYSTAWRLHSQDSSLIDPPANVNSDDGDRNFDRGIVKNRFDLLTEADLAYKNLGAFVRFRAFYDDIYAHKNDNDSPFTSNNVSKPYDEFTSDTYETMGRDYEFMDYFLYGSFKVANRDINLRVGNQVVSWGESLFLLGGVSTAQGPLDAVAANVPGVELKELFIPVEQLYVQADLTDFITVEGFYQWKWDKTRLNAAGSYFSTADMIDDGGESLILAPGFAFTRGNDQEAKDSGQWGVALHYLAESLNGTDFGFYYINYHDKLPQFNLDFGSGEYFLSYIEDIHLFGASVGTVVGDTNVGIEFTYRENQPVKVSTGAIEQVPVIQGQVSIIHLFGANPLMDDLTLTMECGFNRVNSLDNDDLANDKFAWGYTAQLKPVFYNVLSGLDLDLPITLSQGVQGTSSMAGTFSEDVNKLGVSANFTYLSKYQVSFGYANYFGKNSPISDRDLVSMSLKYTF